jgi:glycosyltransferase involved in cell wall biosynthesis
MERNMIVLEHGVSVVIPAYNSESTLPTLVSRLKRVLDGIGKPFEVILVNDGSRDRSWQVICEQIQSTDFVRGFELMRNYGQHNALLCGIRAAQYDVVITMDDDLQNPPEQIPLLLDKLSEGYDVVYGTPEVRQHQLWRNLASDLTKYALKVALGADIAYKASAFRAFRTQIREAFSDYRSSYVSIDVLLTWGSKDFAAVTVRFEPRASGASNYTFRKLAVHALDMVTGFSTVPMRLASIIGFTFTIFGFLVLVFVVGRYLIQGSSVPGFPFLASVIAIFSGVQLFCLGIMGEYIARMHFRMLERPTYSVKCEIGHNDQGGE